jgi:stage II sporulation protein E
MVLMECDIRRRLKVSIASATLPGCESEISGDSSLAFESGEDYFYSLISDGMGSGELAKRTSQFVCDYIKSAMKLGSAKETLLHILNHTIRARGEECSATVDLFELDLLNGGGMFLKSGAAPSYIKRESSIFRIRSQTTPIGLLRSIDTEKISVEIRPGDHIIMMSDGVCDVTEDAPWLLLLLGEPVKKSLKEYVDYIISEAKKNSHTSDDISVTVIRVEEA